MTKEEKCILKQKALEIKEQNLEFRKKRKALFTKQSIASMKYEDSMVGEDGKAHVFVDLTKVSSPFSVYSYEKRIDPEIYSYIEDQVYFLRAAVPVVINFDDGGKYSEEKREIIRHRVKRYFTLQYEDKRFEYFKSIFEGIILAIIGFVILAAYIALSATVLKDNPIFIEIFCILSWVFIWESADKFFFTGHQNRVDISNTAQLALAEITFEKVKK